jgi:hypothetical protein
MKTITIIQQLSSIYLAVIFSGAAINGFYDQVKTNVSAWEKILSDSKTCALKLFFAIVVLIPAGTAVQFYSVLAMLTILAIGTYQNFRSEAGCMCFGGASKLSVSSSHAIHAIGLACCFILFIEAEYSGVPQFVQYLVFIAYVSGLFAFLNVINRKPKAPELPKTLPTLEPEFAVGVDTKGTQWKLRELVQAGRPLFIVGVHSKCKVCKSLIPDIKSFATGFSDQFPIVMVSDISGYLETSLASFKLLFDSEQMLYRTLSTNSYPFAIIVNDDGRVMSYPARGDQGVRSLFAIMLGARHPIQASN